MFQGFRVEHNQQRTTLSPYGSVGCCVYMEDDGSYVAHTAKGNKLGKLDKPRGEYTLTELQELCKLVL